MQVVDARLAEVCRREHPRLVGLLALHVGDRLVAEELAQETLVRLCRQWPRGIERPEAWLTTVALNVANSWLRRRFAEHRANRRHGVGDAAAAELDPADLLAVRRAIARLPQRQRTVVVLRFYERLSVAETAELMGCAQGTVKALTHRAIERLRSVGLLQTVEEAEHA